MFSAVHFDRAAGSDGGATLDNQNRILDSVSLLNRLSTADQVRVGNVIRYYQPFTSQAVLLHEQLQSGDPCEGDTALIAPNP